MKFNHFLATLYLNLIRNRWESDIFNDGFCLKKPYISFASEKYIQRETTVFSENTLNCYYKTKM